MLFLYKHARFRQYFTDHMQIKYMLNKQRRFAPLVHKPAAFNFYLNTLRPRNNGRHFWDHIFKCIFLNANIHIRIKISLKFIHKGPIRNIPALVQIMAWRRPCDKPLSEPMVVNLPTHICVTRPQWVKQPLPLCISVTRMASSSLNNVSNELLHCDSKPQPGPRLNIKTVLSTYGDFHVKDKTAVRTSYL